MAPIDQSQRQLLEQLLERLDDIVEIKVQLGVLNATMKTVQDQQQSLVGAIKGNGKPGLDERVRILEAANVNRSASCPLLARIQQLESFRDAAIKAVEESEKEREERAKEWRTMRIGLIASIVMLILSALSRILVP